MEIWEQSDEQRIAAAQARWAVEFVNRCQFEHGWCVRDGAWRRVADAECMTCHGCKGAQAA